MLPGVCLARRRKTPILASRSSPSAMAPTIRSAKVSTMLKARGGIVSGQYHGKGIGLGFHFLCAQDGRFKREQLDDNFGEGSCDFLLLGEIIVEFRCCCVGAIKQYLLCAGQERMKDCTQLASASSDVSARGRNLPSPRQAHPG